MDIIYTQAAAIDVHKRTAVATIGLVDERGQRTKQTRTFSTMLADLERLADWLIEHRVTHVALESTGVYWRPIFNVLEARGLVVVLANAAHVKAVPGRKTDVRLRHEVVSVAVEPERSGLNLVFCHQYPTVACG